MRETIFSPQLPRNTIQFKVTCYKSGGIFCSLLNFESKVNNALRMQNEWHRKSERGRDDAKTIKICSTTYLLAVIDHKEVLKCRQEARKMQHMLERQSSLVNSAKTNSNRHDVHMMTLHGVVVNGEREGAWKQSLMGGL